MARKIFSDYEKMKIILDSFGDGVVITEHCAKNRVSRSTFYSWLKAFCSPLANVNQKASNRASLGRKNPHSLSRTI